MTTPIVFLDVDGVLAPFRRPGPEWKQQRAVVDGHTYKLWLNPGHGRQLLDLAEKTGAELVWATAWDHHANEWIAPRIGLPELPVCTVDQANAIGTTGASRKVSFKTVKVADYAKGRPFVWFDDGLWLGDEQYLASRADVGAFHLRHIFPYTGLADGDLEFAAEWLRTGGRAA